MKKFYCYLAIIAVFLFLFWNQWSRLLTRSLVFPKKEKVMLSGSVAMETFALAVAELLEEMDGVWAEPQFIGSSTGIEDLKKGKAQIAMVSRYLTEEEKDLGLVENIVAWDGIVVVVHEENPVSMVSKEDLIGLFTGEISNWKQLGGDDRPVIAIGRELGSGTRDSFEKLLGITGKSRYSNECDSIGVVKEKVALLKGAIGYVSLESVNKVKALAVEGVYPSRETIGDGTYFLVRPFIFATFGSLKGQESPVKKIFLRLKSKQGEIVFEKAGVGAVEKGWDTGKSHGGSCLAYGACCCGSHRSYYILSAF